MAATRHLFMAMGVVLSLLALVCILTDTRFRNEFGKCVTLHFHNCTNLEDRHIPDKFHIGTKMTINKGIAIAIGVFLLYMTIAFGAVYGRHLGLVNCLVHLVDQHPLLKLVLVGLFNFMMSLVVNISCSRLCSYIQTPEELQFVLWLQVSCIFFLMGGLTTVDFGFIDALTAMGLNLALIKIKSKAYIPDAILTAFPGAARYFAVSGFIYRESQRMERERQIQIQRDRDGEIKIQGEREQQIQTQTTEEGLGQSNKTEGDGEIERICVLVGKVCTQVNETVTNASKSMTRIEELGKDPSIVLACGDKIDEAESAFSKVTANRELAQAAQQNCTERSSITTAIEAMEIVVGAVQEAFAASTIVVNVQIDMEHILIGKCLQPR